MVCFRALGVLPMTVRDPVTYREITSGHMMAAAQALRHPDDRHGLDGVRAAVGARTRVGKSAYAVEALGFDARTATCSTSSHTRTGRGMAAVPARWPR